VTEQDGRRSFHAPGSEATRRIRCSGHGARASHPSALQYLSRRRPSLASGSMVSRCRCVHARHLYRSRALENGGPGGRLQRQFFGHRHTLFSRAVPAHVETGGRRSGDAGPPRLDHRATGDPRSHRRIEVDTDQFKKGKTHPEKLFGRSLATWRARLRNGCRQATRNGSHCFLAHRSSLMPSTVSRSRGSPRPTRDSRSIPTAVSPGSDCSASVSA